MFISFHFISFHFISFHYNHNRRIREEYEMNTSIIPAIDVSTLYAHSFLILVAFMIGITFIIIVILFVYYLVTEDN
jgi:hypothetical protein